MYKHLNHYIVRIVQGFLSFMVLSSPAVQAFSTSTQSVTPRYVGIDLGTSGARISIIEKNHQQQQQFNQVYTDAVRWNDGDYDSPDAWMSTIEALLQGATTDILDSVVAICCSGTSASCLVVDSCTGRVTRNPRMYNFDTATMVPDPILRVRATQWIEQYVPDKHTARSTTGSLLKLLTWHEQATLQKEERLVHQADYVAWRLRSQRHLCGSNQKQPIVYSDWHNSLKLGYDVRQLDWPHWLLDCVEAAGIPASVLPEQVVSPGEIIGTISKEMAGRLRLPDIAVVVGGTTDSNAAFFAATEGKAFPGTAVTSLGSTLALKLLSSTYIEDSSVGVYSHRFPSVLLDGQEAWLVGGASNVGCAILRQEQFSTDELDQLSRNIDPNIDSPLQYYPLTKAGERFPVADSNKPPVLDPQPDDRKDYLHGILQGIANVERDGYELLGKLGSTPATPSILWTCGGGSRNDMWTLMRQRILREAFVNEVEVHRANNMEASFGAAILAAGMF